MNHIEPKLNYKLSYFEGAVKYFIFASVNICKMNITQHFAINRIANYLTSLCKFVIYFPVLSCLLFPMLAYSVTLDDQPLITLDKGQISIYRDKTSQLTFNEIRQEKIKSQFEPLEANLSAGYVPDTFWLHISLNRLDAQSSARWLEVIPPYLDSIDLYHINPKGLIEHRKGGDYLPQSVKEEIYRGHVFKLDFEPGQHELYLRLKTSSTMVALLKLWQPSAFDSHLRNSYFVLGLYFSLILTVLILNIANWFVSKRVIFVVYSLYLVLNSVQWLGINGLIAEFIFPEQPLLANLSLGMSLSLSASMAFIFFSMLFEFRKYHAFLYRYNQVGATLGIVTAIATPLGYYQLFAPWLLLIAIISLAFAPRIIIRLWRTQENWNRLLVVSYSIFTILVSLNILSSLAVLPYNEPITYAGMVSNIFHVLIIHFAIMLHYHRLENMHKESLKQATIMKTKIELEQNYREEQSQLLAMITHEIRTPIAVINAANESLQLIDDRTSLNEERTLRYNRINNAVMRMNMVMEMALAQEGNDNLSFEIETINLVELTNDVINLSGGNTLQRIVFDMPIAKVSVPADIRLLRIALLNLLNNALKYSPKESVVNIAIEQSVVENNKGTSWIIDDTGPGIADELREKIFDKYQRGDERSNNAGMGLGLFLVARIVERHDGNVTIASSPSGGSRFCLWLPNKPNKN